MTQQRKSQVSFADNAQRVEVINSLREIKNSIRQKEEELVLSQSPKKLTHLIQQADNLFDKVSTPSAMSHDCETFRNITQIAVTQVSSVSLGPKSLNLANVRTNLLSKYSDNEGGLDFEKIGDWALRNSKVAPISAPVLFGLGQFQPVHKERAKGVRSQKDVIEEVKNVDLKKVQESRTDSLISRAKKLCERLEKNGATPISNVITAPSSFAQTVENAFDLAHLVRDGRVGIASGKGTIIATTATGNFAQNDSRKQCVLHLVQSQYQKLLNESQNEDFQGDLV